MKLYASAINGERVQDFAWLLNFRIPACTSSVYRPPDALIECGRVLKNTERKIEIAMNIVNAVRHFGRQKLYCCH